MGLLPENLFSKLVAATRTKPEAFAVQLRQLFTAMRTGGFFGFEQIPQFDGGLFDDDEVLALDLEGIDVLHRIGRLDWDSIEPSVLGTLFERSLDPSKRAQLGAHYTSREDILTIVEPVLMAPLRRRWVAVQEQARNLIERRDVSSGGHRTQRNNELTRLLTGFTEEIAAQRVLDPACGSGNFLYVALTQLLDLEKEVIAFAGEVGLTTFFPRVGPEQVHGIEMNEYAHELATATVWIGYIQWLRDNGFGRPSEPILKPLETVSRMDAILMYDDQGTSIEPEWPEAELIVGNSPFLGIRKMRQELDNTYVEDLRRLYEGRLPSSVELVCYWFEKARALIEAGTVERVGLLATNSIRGGANRKVLQRIKAIGDIFFAESDRPWILEGAAVRVSMIGFDNGSEKERTIDGSPVSSINTDLTATADLSQAKRLSENRGVSFQGTAQAGPFEIEESVAKAMLAAGVNPNGRTNSDVVKRSINGLDITRRPRRIWTIDFGVNMPPDEAALYEEPFEYVRKHVKPHRDKVRRKRRREKWWLFGEAAPGMRKAIAPLPRYIATPWVSKYRLFVWIPTSLIPSLVGVFARDDDYFFGVLHSRAHEIWARRMGTYMGAGNDLRYTLTTCFETFPFPWAPGKEPATDLQVETIAEAARRLDELRHNWLSPEGVSEVELKKRTLTNLYNARPTWLQHAHENLDRAVFAAYGWSPDLPDEEILKNLLALNLKRSGEDSEYPNAVS